MGAEPLFAEITSRLRRAARNGTRLHLDPAHARALMQPRFYALFAEAEAEEITSTWEKDSDSGPQSPRPANDSNSGSSGSGTGPTGTTGASAGSKAVQLAAAGRASEAAKDILRRKQRKGS